MQQNLNLARKWRSKTFDTIVGQPLPVRMLKNSLYLGHFFPVYLLSGQRGCGKTSTARVFAAAINCERLSDFQKSPKEFSVPCNECSSCQAMEQGKHPDFIEIDAASHTGVDNVRTIIDAASFMPLSSGKKIYLIDEAHMLSKAAFSAFLKILEDPPQSVVFMLATTDPQKIISTVMSRSFQLFFTPIAQKDLQQHLRLICDTEKIQADDEALGLIVRESEGSARDAINLLEQVRFSSERVTTAALFAVLGHVSDDIMVRVFETVALQSHASVLQLLLEIKSETYAAERLYQKLVAFVRAAIWLKHSLQPPSDISDPDLLKKIVKNCSLERLSTMFITLCDYEQAFLKTTRKHVLFELILLQLSNGDEAMVSVAPSQTAPVTTAAEIKKETVSSASNTEWECFLLALNAQQDPLTSSIFVQARFVSYDAAANIIALEFSKQFTFFKELLHEGESIWRPILESVYKPGTTVTTSFDGVEPADTSNLKKGISAQTSSVEQAEKGTPALKKALKREVPLDVSDKELWGKTNAVLERFPGAVTEVVGGTDEETS